MNQFDISTPELSQLAAQRLALMRSLAGSLESSSGALLRNDAEAIARGAAHQAELCRQWSLLEDELRRQTARRALSPKPGALEVGPDGASAAGRSAQLQAEWDSLSARIRYLTRVHCSLLRHLRRSLAVLTRVVDGCAPTYTLEAGVPRAERGLASENRPGE